MLKAALAKIAHGLLVGIGFGFAVGAVMYGYAAWQMKEMQENKGEMFGGLYKEYTAEAGLVIKEHRPQRTDNNSAFLGVISNRGKDSWENVEVLTELFAKDGTFVDKCSSYMDGSVAPGQDRNFKVSCSGCRDVSVPLVYDKYTIAIVGAQFVRPEKVGSN
jgi:hypothetical protein